MSITISAEKARTVFLKALALLDAGEPLPDEWIQYSRKIGAGPSKTFVAMLGTALLVRATEPSADPLALKASAIPSKGFQSHSARSIATDVLAPMAVEHSIDIGTRGREPLNNQPFFRFDRVSTDMTVRSSVRPHLKNLVDALEAIKGLSDQQLVPALAAFLAVRRRTARRPPARTQVAKIDWTIMEFVESVANFVTSWPEDGKRGQALAAAVFDLVFEKVDLGHINDPSRRLPGDVLARVASFEPLPAEVKQKAVSKSDIVRWASRLEEQGFSRGAYLAFAPLELDFDPRIAEQEILTQFNVLVRIYSSVAEFIYAAISWSGRDPDSFMSAFVDAMHTRLFDSDVTPESLSEWNDLFQV